MRKNKSILIISFLMLLFSVSLQSCKDKKANPKPYAYFRIDLAEKAYRSYVGDCPYRFEYSEQAAIYPGDDTNPCWLNIHYPVHDATIYLTYKSLNDNLVDMTEDAREFAYQHTVKAESINELSFDNDSLNAYGILYNLTGNVASPVQFYMTDSTNHFLRGALYFNMRPNKDSLAPVINYIREDIVHIMETTSWK
ncbi:MAG: gliding motility lipoprotein GldD [Bacteroidales bacterium]|jgi:gliding motility-associated lipoprotein GldD|nr:gliding motility lipoprotein GldD [Bacteroidales bacterium]